MPELVSKPSATRSNDWAPSLFRKATKRSTLPLVMTGLSSALQGVVAQSSETSFFETIGEFGDEFTGDAHVAQNGDIITVGHSHSFGSSNKAWVARSTLEGQLIWSRVIGGSGYDHFSAVTEDTSTGDIVVVGETSSFGSGSTDGLIALFSASGDLKWAKACGGVGVVVDTFLDVAITSNKTYRAVGFTASYGAGSYDALITEFDQTGNQLSALAVGGINDDRGRAIVEKNDGTYFVVGSTASGGAGGVDALVMYMNPAGIAWAKVIGGFSTDEANGIQINNAGVIVTGSTSSFGDGSSDVLTLQMNEMGNVLWTRVSGGPGTDDSIAVAVLPNGDNIICGYTSSFGAVPGPYDGMLVRLAANGAFIDSRILQGSRDNRFVSVQALDNGGYLEAGYTNSKGMGNYDAFLARTDANGSIANCSAFQTITPTTQAITPSDSFISPTVQLITPIVVDINAAAIVANLTVQQHCYNNPTTGTTGTSGTTGTTGSTTAGFLSTGLSMLATTASGFFTSSSSNTPTESNDSSSQNSENSLMYLLYIGVPAALLLLAIGTLLTQRFLQQRNQAASDSSHSGDLELRGGVARGLPLTDDDAYKDIYHTTSEVDDQDSKSEDHYNTYREEVDGPNEVVYNTAVDVQNSKSEDHYNTYREEVDGPNEVFYNTPNGATSAGGKPTAADLDPNASGHYLATGSIR